MLKCDFKKVAKQLHQRTVSIPVEHAMASESILRLVSCQGM